MLNPFYIFTIINDIKKPNFREKLDIKFLIYIKNFYFFDNRLRDKSNIKYKPNKANASHPIKENK